MTDAVVTGKEQLILLPIESTTFPLPTDELTPLPLDTGGHAIVASGYATIVNPDGTTGTFHGAGDDEEIVPIDVQFLVGPVWRDVVQVSACVSPAGILSLDSDEVDTSQWIVRGCTWDVVDVPDGERIRLKIETEIQGFHNGWESFAYQVVATGWLRRMPTPDEISADLS